MILIKYAKIGASVRMEASIKQKPPTPLPPGGGEESPALSGFLTGKSLLPPPRQLRVAIKSYDFRPLDTLHF